MIGKISIFFVTLVIAGAFVQTFALDGDNTQQLQKPNLELDLVKQGLTFISDDFELPNVVKEEEELCPEERAALREDCEDLRESQSSLRAIFGRLTRVKNAKRIIERRLQRVCQFLETRTSAILEQIKARLQARLDQITPLHADLCEEQAEALLEVGEKIVIKGTATVTLAECLIAAKNETSTESTEE